MVIPCLIEHIDNVTNANCRAFLKRMESIVFSDYRLIYKFADKCGSDITKFTCGRLPTLEDEAVSWSIYFWVSPMDCSASLGLLDRRAACSDVLACLLVQKFRLVDMI